MKSQVNHESRAHKTAIERALHNNARSSVDYALFRQFIETTESIRCCFASTAIIFSEPTWKRALAIQKRARLGKRWRKRISALYLSLAENFYWSAWNPWNRKKFWPTNESFQHNCIVFLRNVKKEIRSGYFFFFFIDRFWDKFNSHENQVFPNIGLSS